MEVDQVCKYGSIVSMEVRMYSSTVSIDTLTII